MEKRRAHSTIEALESRIAPAFAATIDLSALSGADGFTVPGKAFDNLVGYSVKTAGDINNDGFDDMLIGALGLNATYVIFGKAAAFMNPFNFAALNGSDGFRIQGENTGDNLGTSVSSAGDLNGDNFDDIIIGAVGSNANGNSSGACYVVFGKASGFAAVLNVTSLDGTNGFRIPGEAAFNGLGRNISGGGDVNGDGFDDVIIGSPASTTRGTAYVIFGHGGTFTASLDLTSLDGSNGFKVPGEMNGDRAANSVSVVGDINNDGFDDVLIGASDVNFNVDSTSSGAAYLVFGKMNGFDAVLSLSDLNGSNGFKIIPQGAKDKLGRSVSGAGDMNGDGFADIIIGAKDANASGRESGASYVIFGKLGGFTSPMNVSILDGSNGFRIDGARADDNSGRTVSAAGDVNGDGFDDVAVAAYGPLRDFTGVAYVVFGHPGTFTKTVKVNGLNGDNGFTIRGEETNDGAGTALGSAGDINGDGFDDLLIGADRADPNGSASGSAYVIFGQSPVRIISKDHIATLPDADGDRITITVNKGQLTLDNIVRAEDGSIELIDLTGADFNGVNLTIKVVTPKGVGGDGFINVGMIKADGVNLGNVKIKGDLGLILAGSNDPTKFALKSLNIQNLGAEVAAETLVSEILGKVGSITINGSVRNAGVEITGDLGRATIKGDLIGEGELPEALAGLAAFGLNIPRVGGGVPTGAFLANNIGSFGVGGSVNGGSVNAGGDIGNVKVGGDVKNGGVTAMGALKVMKVFGKLVSDDPMAPVIVTALSRLGTDKPKSAAGINLLFVRGNVENAEVLVGYDRNHAGKNPDASVGKVVVNGDWMASSLTAGILDSTDDGFGQNDTLIPEPVADSILAKIGSIVIKGTATGSVAAGDHFGITAQQIGSLKIDGQKLALNKDVADNILLDATNMDFRVVEVATP